MLVTFAGGGCSLRFGWCALAIAAIIGVPLGGRGRSGIPVCGGGGARRGRRGLLLEVSSSRDSRGPDGVLPREGGGGGVSLGHLLLLHRHLLLLTQKNDKGVDTLRHKTHKLEDYNIIPFSAFSSSSSHLLT